MPWSGEILDPYFGRVCLGYSADFFSGFSNEKRRSSFFSSFFFFSTLYSWSHFKYSFLEFTPFSFFESLFFFCKETWLPWLEAGLFNTTVTSSSFLSSSSISYSFLVTQSEGACNPVNIRCHHKTLQFPCKMGILFGHFPKCCCGHNTCEKWESMISTFPQPAQVVCWNLDFLPLLAPNFLLSMYISEKLLMLVFKNLFNSGVSPPLHQKPFLLSAASTLSPEHDAIFVYSRNIDVIILALLAILLQGIQVFRNENRSQVYTCLHFSNNYSSSRLIPILGFHVTSGKNKITNFRFLPLSGKSHFCVYCACAGIH